MLLLGVFDKSLTVYDSMYIGLLPVDCSTLEALYLASNLAWSWQHKKKRRTRMSANAQRDGRPAKHRSQPLRKFRNSIPCTMLQSLANPAAGLSCSNAANIHPVTEKTGPFVISSYLCFGSYELHENFEKYIGSVASCEYGINVCDTLTILC